MLRWWPSLRPTSNAKVVDILNLGSNGQTRFVIGEVLAIHISEDVLDGTRVDNDALQAVGADGGQHLHQHSRPIPTRTA